MTFAASSLLRCVLAVAIQVAGGCCSAQPSRSISNPTDLTWRPRLCHPVSYRQPSVSVRVGTVVPMLSDRYLEAGEALSGWNQSGTPLVGKYNGNWEPVPCGDDSGLFYLATQIARQSGWALDKALNVFFLGTVVFCAFIGTAGVCFTFPRAWQKAVAVTPVIVGSYIALKIGDVYLVQASIALMLIPWLIFVLRESLTLRQRFAIVVFSGCFLGLAQWVRTQSAPPILVFFGILAFSSPLRRSTRILLFAGLIGGMCLPLLYSQFPLHERDRFLLLHQTDYSPTVNRHLFWHTTYLGLSYLTNPYVPAWRDSDAVAYVQTISPTAIYAGPQYESILRERVKQIALQDHRFLLQTAAAKLGVIASLLLLCANVGIPASILRPKRRGVELAFWLAMIVAGLPGVLAIPLPQYLVGMLVLALYYCCYSVVWYVESSLHGPSTLSYRCCAEFGSFRT